MRARAAPGVPGGLTDVACDVASVRPALGRMDYSNVTLGEGENRVRIPTDEGVGVISHDLVGARHRRSLTGQPDEPYADVTGLRVAVVGINYAPEVMGIAPYTTAMCEDLAARGATVEAITGLPHYPEWRIHDEGDWQGDGTTRNGVTLRRVSHHVPSRMSAVTRGRYEWELPRGGSSCEPSRRIVRRRCRGGAGARGRACCPQPCEPGKGAVRRNRSGPRRQSCGAERYPWRRPRCGCRRLGRAQRTAGRRRRCHRQPSDGSDRGGVRGPQRPTRISAELHPHPDVFRSAAGRHGSALAGRATGSSPCIQATWASSRIWTTW